MKQLHIRACNHTKPVYVYHAVVGESQRLPVFPSLYYLVLEVGGRSGVVVSTHKLSNSRKLRLTHSGKRVCQYATEPPNYDEVINVCTKWLVRILGKAPSVVYIRAAK